MEQLALPTPFDVREVLEGLLGRDVTVDVCPPYLPGPDAPALLGTYVDDRLALRTVAVVDVPLGANLGAAVGLIPRAQAAEAAESGLVPANLLDNLREVLNVLASTLNRAGQAHQRLYELHAAGTLPPADVSSWAKVPVGRLDLQVGIAGYGGGQLGFVACD